MSVLIPLRNDLLHFDEDIQLDGQTYNFEFLWNDRAEGWFYSIFAADGTAIIEGQRFVVNARLAARERSSAIFPGLLMAQDSTGAGEDPGIADLGVRTLLLYFPIAELTPA